MNFWQTIKSWFSPLPSRPDNTGIILAPLKDTDYVAGVNSPIPYQIRIPDGNWKPYTWSQVKQWCVKNGIYQDNLGCTGNSLATDIETQLFFLTGKQIQISRRWINKMAGTNQGALKGMGNYMSAPAEWVRSNGFVLESSYPTPASWTVDEYYADIPEPLNSQLLQEGKQSLQKYRLQYEFLQVTDPNLDYHLKHAPVSVIIPGHDICGIYSPDANMQYRDSYEPWDKTTPISGLQAAMKAILTPTGILAREVGWQGSPELGLYLPFDSMQRRDFIRQNISTWLADYSVDTSKTYSLPVKKPDFNN